MPAKASRGASGKLDIPSTILRSDKHAQNLWTKAHDSALKTYGEGARKEAAQTRRKQTASRN